MVTIRLTDGRVLHAGIHPDQVSRLRGLAWRSSTARMHYAVVAATKPGGKVEQRRFCVGQIISIEG